MQSKGYSLLELLMVITIIVILCGAAIPLAVVVRGAAVAPDAVVVAARAAGAPGSGEWRES